MAVTLLAHLWVGRLDGPEVYLLRILYATSIAGAFGSSITYVSLHAPAERMAETIGMLGTSGFVGLALGPVIGDMLMDVPELSRDHVNRMFLVAAAMAGVSFVCAAIATRSHVHAIRRNPPPLTYLIRRYHPGTILLVGMAMGAGLGLPNTFLRTYAMEIGVAQIKWFFLVYAAVAFGVRFATRGLADRWGVRPTIYLGLNCLAVTMLLFLVASTEWLLVVPAVMGGVAHALLFPAVVSGANLSFPRRYRGLATTLIMAMFDLGNLVGQPSVGALLEVASYVGLPRYGTMFVTVAAALIAVSAIYAVSGRRRMQAIGSREQTTSLGYDSTIPAEAKPAAACASGPNA
jgi:MFS family permease